MQNWTDIKWNILAFASIYWRCQPGVDLSLKSGILFDKNNITTARKQWTFVSCPHSKFSTQKTACKHVIRRFSSVSLWFNFKKYLFRQVSILNTMWIPHHNDIIVLQWTIRFDTENVAKYGFPKEFLFVREDSKL